MGRNWGRNGSEVRMAQNQWWQYMRGRNVAGKLCVAWQAVTGSREMVRRAEAGRRKVGKCVVRQWQL